MSAADVEDRARLSLLWLVRLRWIAVAGQIGALLFARRARRAEIPVGPFLAVVTLTALSNVAVRALLASARPLP
ncbi:MAG TPA: hypothetical protein VMV60_14700 [Thermoanaerobaculia bacterium]|nr:hypothetical protein [Thermoanaerobaculia bacterium]